MNFWYMGLHHRLMVAAVPLALLWLLIGWAT